MISSLHQLTEHVYWLSPDETTDRPTLGAVVGKQATLIVDAGNSVAHANLFLTELAKVEGAKPTYVVLTHWHWDHVFGAAAFDLPIFAHIETQRGIAAMIPLDWSDEALDQRVAAGTEIEFCREMIKAELPDRTNLSLKLPNIAFSNEVTFDLGGVSCLVKHVGGDHAADASIVHVLEDKVLFLSDCLYENLHHGPHHYTSAKLFPLIDKILSFEAEHYIWGHHSAPMPANELLTFTQTLRTIGESVEQTGNQRDLILSSASETLRRPLNDDDIEIIDAFLAGL